MFYPPYGKKTCITIKKKKLDNLKCIITIVNDIKHYGVLKVQSNHGLNKVEAIIYDGYRDQMSVSYKLCFIDIMTKCFQVDNIGIHDIWDSNDEVSEMRNNTRKDPEYTLQRYSGFKQKRGVRLVGP